MLSADCNKCNSKKNGFIKEQGKWLFSSLGLKNLLCKIPLLGDVLF